MMAGAARSLGWHPFPGPAAITSGRYEGRSGCVYHGFCNRGGCHVSAKGSTAVTTIPKAQRTKRLTVVTEAHVTSIDVDAQGRASGVTYRKGTEEFFQPASVVLLASYTYENVRLLLLSTSKAFPKGLSNNHGQVGRHYFSHNQIATVNALFGRNLNTWYGLPAQGIAVDDWADDNFDHRSLDFIGGGNLWDLLGPPADRRRQHEHVRARAAWGAQWKAFIRENADRANTAYLQRTTLPYEDNYLDLDPTVKDPLGFPGVPHHRRLQGERAPARRLHPGQDGRVVPRRRCGGDRERRRSAPWAHDAAYGGTRMGDNPDTNVVNRWGFSHEVPNLGILGASVMGRAARAIPRSLRRPWPGALRNTWGRTGKRSPFEDRIVVPIGGIWLTNPTTSLPPNSWERTSSSASRWWTTRAR
jgi:gluconate 2-dehydrogenase alpha chain